MKNPAHPHSEWSAIKTWKQKKQLKKLICMWACSLGSVFFPPLGLLLKIGSNKRMNEIRIVHQHYGQDAEMQTEILDPEANEYHSNSQEIFMFINGVSTNRDLQWENGMHLADVFKRDIYLIHNPTEGMLFDLIECEMGRTLRIMIRVARVCANLMLEQLRLNPDKKLIIIAHSQGSIIISDAIKYIIKKNAGEGLDRVEVYTFGCAATQFFQVIDKRNDSLVPFYEHFANLKDFVARTGVLRSRSYIRGKCDYYPFPGDIFECNKEGHLLGEHYLPRLLLGEFTCALFPEKSPRLLTYVPKDFTTIAQVCK